MLIDLQRKHKPNTWVFDNDGTLYTKSKEKQLEKEFMVIMFKYLANLYNIDVEAAVSKRDKLIIKHNTRNTMLALRAEGLDENVFIKNTYLKIDLNAFGITVNPQLKETLESLNGEKFVFTNSPSSFAKKILRIVGIEHLFTNIIGVQEMSYIQKPDLQAFKQMQRIIREKSKVLFLDDDINNLNTAKKIGWETALVGKRGVF